MKTIPFAVIRAKGTKRHRLVNWFSFQFRPDPALYIAVMCGQIQVYHQRSISLASTKVAVLESSGAVAQGWKSIMGVPDKKPRRSKKRSGKKE